MENTSNVQCSNSDGWIQVMSNVKTPEEGILKVLVSCNVKISKAGFHKMRVI